MTSDVPRHLHYAAIAVEAVGSALQLAAAAALVAVVRGGTPGTAAALALLGIVISAVIAYVRWRATTYWLDDVALHYRSGVFTPDERVVPRTRVQALDTATGPLQRIFGVVEVRVQVPGAEDEDEIVLAAVTSEEISRLRRELGQAEPAAPDVRVTLGSRDLLLAAITSPQISVAVSAVAGVFAFFNEVVDLSAGESLVDRLDAPGEIALAAAIILAGGYVVSFVAGLVVFAGFEAERDAQVLRIRRGLLARRALSIPLQRVDGVVILEGLLRGPLGLAALRLESVAHGSEGASGRTLLPLVRRRDAEAVISRLIPLLAIEPGTLERPPRRALRQFVLVPAAQWGILAAVVALLWLPAAWPVAAPLAAIAAVLGFRSYRAAGLRLAGDVVVVRETRLARRTLIARRHRLQQHELEQTVLQQRARLADLSVTVGSGGRSTAQYLESGTAQTAFERLRR
ncbi:MAG: PH domain-containing protein [Actinomycetota bacterium]|nr:PH domain-containing protein [Actinomycetota bacterium]